MPSQSVHFSFLGGIFLSLLACSGRQPGSDGATGTSASGGNAMGSGAASMASGDPRRSSGGMPLTGGVAAVGGAPAERDDNSESGGASGDGAAGNSGGAGSGGPGGQSGTGGSGGMMGTGGSLPDSECESLVSDPSVNWRESGLQSDQEIVECLFDTLGRPVGYGENAQGGYDPGGDSHLVVIKKGLEQSVEEQILSAISSADHNWIVFDKEDFSSGTEIGMYRLHCGEPTVTEAIGGNESECLDYQNWCTQRGVTGEEECLEQFFNQALNDSDLPIRNPVVASNTTLDGRMSEAYFRFSGFAIGSDSSGEPVETATDVILTHLEFRGAGHTEDHELDPDMIRATGASHDIWIHKNTFELTGDSAFDVKVGAYDVTMSFNRLLDVVRASLHGSSDSREINEQITTTMHHNAFVTRDEFYESFGNTGRRVPLVRRGSSHMWNNFFMNYRKDVISVRVGAHLLWEGNALAINAIYQEKDSLEDSLAERAEQLTRDVDDGNYRGEEVYLWFSDANCSVDEATKTRLTDASGSVDDLAEQYSSESRAAIAAVRMDAGQDLIDYVKATAGKRGERPFNSPLAPSVAEVISGSSFSCQ